MLKLSCQFSLNLTQWVMIGFDTLCDIALVLYAKGKINQFADDTAFKKISVSIWHEHVNLVTKMRFPSPTPIYIKSHSNNKSPLPS